MKLLIASLASTLLAFTWSPGQLAPRSDWGAPGRYTPTVKIEPVHTFYYPADLARSDRRHPVIIWGNGTFAIPGMYSGLLRHLASHGFIVAAANTTQSNFAISMLNGIDRLKAHNADPKSPFHGKVDLANVGASGHSQGGAAAINAGRDSRVRTSVAIQPGPLASAKPLHSPLLLLAGEKDTIVPPMSNMLSWIPFFFHQASHVPTVYAERAGADHFEAGGNGGGFRAITTAWFRYFLMKDRTAHSEFFGHRCGICTSDGWSQVKRNNKVLGFHRQNQPQKLPLLLG